MIGNGAKRVNYGIFRPCYGTESSVRIAHGAPLKPFILGISSDFDSR